MTTHGLGQYLHIGHTLGFWPFLFTILYTKLYYTASGQFTLEIRLASSLSCLAFCRLHNTSFGQYLHLVIILISGLFCLRFRNMAFGQYLHLAISLASGLFYLKLRHTTFGQYLHLEISLVSGLFLFKIQKYLNYGLWPIFEFGNKFGFWLFY